MTRRMSAHYDFEGSGADVKQIAPFVDGYVIDNGAEQNVGDIYTLKA